MKSDEACGVPQGCKCVIVGEQALLKLAIRYMGIGKPLTHDDTEILLFALYNESEVRGGIIATAKVEADRIWKAQTEGQQS